MKNQSPLLPRSKNLRIMVQCAILIAMGTVLSMIQIPMPWLIWGGSLTPLSMLPICLIGLLNGPKWGLGSAFIYSVFQLLLGNCFAWGLTPTVLVICIIFDYIVAFSVLGISGFFKGRSKTVMCVGIAVAVLLRMLCHYITGVTIWESSMPDSFNNVWLYSLVYNGSYMLPETILTVAGGFAILSVPKLWSILKVDKA